jgi:hypothetical protein
VKTRTLTVDYYHVRGTRADVALCAHYRGKRLFAEVHNRNREVTISWARAMAAANGFSAVRFRDSTRYGQSERVTLMKVAP